ncbi:hypothetical protein [Rosistilla carotiformis]|uniref:hypothetical protein n=1 Tax=Rosistilla carotiformis TaxID=2528017 RepID=UPI0011A25956|nr:hypothetical protein [Rosistilla carotiformis]
MAKIRSSTGTDDLGRVESVANGRKVDAMGFGDMDIHKRPYIAIGLGIPHVPFGRNHATRTFRLLFSNFRDSIHATRNSRVHLHRNWPHVALLSINTRIP